MSVTPDKFEQWCLVELFGHTKMAGLVSEQTIGGQSFVRVDVPATTKQKPFTRLLGNGAIYSLQPITEEVARGLADKLQVTPLGVWDLPDEVQEAISAGRKLLAAGPTEDMGPSRSQQDDDYDDDEDFERVPTSSDDEDL